MVSTKVKYTTYKSKFDKKDFTKMHEEKHFPSSNAQKMFKHSRIMKNASEGLVSAQNQSESLRNITIKSLYA